MRLLISCLLIVVAFGCKPPTFANPPMQDTKLRLNDTFLSFCEKDDEGATIPMDLTIEVFGYAGANSAPNLMYTDVVTISNDPADAYTLFDLELPSEGSFAVEVTLLGQGNCFSCCHKIAVNGANICLTPDKGRARFRGVSAQYQVSSPPNEIVISPILDNCFNCNGNC